MVNYSNGKIYKIEPVNGDIGDVYIGSTTKKYLSQRMDNHRGRYKALQNGGKNDITSFKLFDKYGVENCSIILLESVDASSKDELHAREAFHIKAYHCINKYIPLRTNKEYYKDNKEKINMSKAVKINCICGSCVRISDKAKHEKTMKHQSYINSLT